MKKLILRSNPRPVKQTNTRSSLYNRQMAITYGAIESNNTDGTTNILLVNGFPANNIKIPSSYWPSKNPTLGGIGYPPIGTEVMILHPVNDIDSGWIIPAPLDERDDTIISDLLSGGDKSLLPGGWEYTYDQTTGDITFINSSSGTIEVNGTIPVARQDDPIASTSSEDSPYWAFWSAMFAVIKGAAIPEPGGGAPSAFQAALKLALAASTPASLTGKITAGSDKVKVG